MSKLNLISNHDKGKEKKKRENKKGKKGKKKKKERSGMKTKTWLLSRFESVGFSYIWFWLKSIEIANKTSTMRMITILDLRSYDLWTKSRLNMFLMPNIPLIKIG